MGVKQFKTTTNKYKKAMLWFLECTLPCSISFVLYNYFAYVMSSLIMEGAHVKGVDLSSIFDRSIPLWSGFIGVYGPAITFWAIMPYIIYGLYGRQHFYRYLSMTLLFSVIAFFLYIMFPTSAVLQREEIMSNNIDKHLSNGNVFDKILLKSYTVAAPYGEVPSGHWGCSLLICLGLIKPKTQKKYTKTGLITLILWTIFAVNVCLATLVLKQHNFVDGFITIVLLGIIYMIVDQTTLSNKVDLFFMWIDIKLGVKQPTKNMKAYKYDDKYPAMYYTKLALTWIIYLSITIWFILATYNVALGGIIGLKLPNYIIPTYSPSYIKNPDGTYIPQINPNNDWKEFLWD